MKLLDNTATMPEKTVKETLRGVFGVNMSSFVIAAVCILFLSTAVLEPSESEASLYDIVVNSALVFAVTMALNYLFKDKAIRDARQRKPVEEAEKDFRDKVKGVVEEDKIDELEEWCKEQNAKNYKIQRCKILAPAGLTYAECFNEDGTPKVKEIVMPKVRDLFALGLHEWIQSRRISRKQIKALIRARYLHLSELSAGELTSEGENANDPYRLGRSVATYIKQTTQRTAVSKIVISVVSGYFFADLIVNFSATNLIIKLMQISMAMVMGAIEYVSTTGYVLNELRDRYIKKTQVLTRFIKKKGADTQNVNEVPGKLGHPDHEGQGAGTTDRELHAPAG